MKSVFTEQDKNMALAQNKVLNISISLCIVLTTIATVRAYLNIELMPGLVINLCAFYAVYYLRFRVQDKKCEDIMMKEIDLIEDLKTDDLVRMIEILDIGKLEVFHFLALIILSCFYVFKCYTSGIKIWIAILLLLIELVSAVPCIKEIARNGLLHNDLKSIYDDRMESEVHD